MSTKIRDPIFHCLGKYVGSAGGFTSHWLILLLRTRSWAKELFNQATLKKHVATASARVWQLKMAVNWLTVVALKVVQYYLLN